MIPRFFTFIVPQRDPSDLCRAAVLVLGVLNPSHPLRQEAGGLRTCLQCRCELCSDAHVLDWQPLLVTRNTVERLSTASELMSRVLASFPPAPPAAPPSDLPADRVR
jgi:hypothetical protein